MITIMAAKDMEWGIRKGQNETSTFQRAAISSIFISFLIHNFRFLLTQGHLA